MTLLGASAGSGTPGASPLLPDGTAEAPSRGVVFGSDRFAVACAEVAS